SKLTVTRLSSPLDVPVSGETVAQGTVEVTVYSSVPGPMLRIASTCGSGLVVVAVATRVSGSTSITGPFTFTRTSICRGEFDAPGSITRIWAVYSPGARSAVLYVAVISALPESPRTPRDGETLS